MKKNILTLFLTVITSFGFAEECCSTNWCGGFEANAELLWWDACGDQLDYGIVIQGTRDTTPTPTIEILTETTLEVEPKWKPGFRFRLDKCIDCLGFNLFGEWTYYKTNYSKSTSLSLGSDPNAFLSFNSDFIGNTGGTTSSLTSFETADINVDFYFQINRFDLGVSKDFCVCDTMFFSPYAGFTYVHTNENLTLTADFQNPTSTFFEQDDYRVKTKYNGFGGTVGCLVFYDINKCFSIFADGSITGLTGSFELDRRFIISEGGTISDIDYTTTSNINKCRSRAISKVQLGLQYSTCYCGSCPVHFYLAWEQQTLYDQTNWYVREGEVATVGTKDATNLSLQGLVAGMGVGF